MTDYNKWQFIETAPTDGTYILIYDKNLEVVISWFGKDLFKEDYEGWLCGDGNDLSVGCYYIPCEPTHWMPLPPPPTK